MKKKLLSEVLDNILPTEALSKGYGLTWWHPSVFRVDPVILYLHGNEIYRWEYIPSLTEVWEKLKEIE